MKKDSFREVSLRTPEVELTLSIPHLPTKVSDTLFLQIDVKNLSEETIYSNFFQEQWKDSSNHPVFHVGYAAINKAITTEIEYVFANTKEIIDAVVYLYPLKSKVQKSFKFSYPLAKIRKEHNVQFVDFPFQVYFNYLPESKLLKKGRDENGSYTSSTLSWLVESDYAVLDGRLWFPY